MADTRGLINSPGSFSVPNEMIPHLTADSDRSVGGGVCFVNLQQTPTFFDPEREHKEGKYLEKMRNNDMIILVS